MRYTRIDLRRKKKDTLQYFIITSLIFITAFILGSVIFNFWMKPGEEVKALSGDDNIVVKSENIASLDITYLQTGVFSVKENAEALKNSISNFVNPIIIEENGKYMVIAGIFVSGEENQVIHTLESEGYSYTRKNKSLVIENNTDEVKLELLKTTLDIINQLYSSEVKSIKTKELKTWVENIDEIPEELTDLKEYILGLGEELPKDKLGELQSKVIKLIK